MLSAAENDLLTRTGPGTPMGATLRRYWIPALLSREIARTGLSAGAGKTFGRSPGDVPR